MTASLFDIHNVVAKIRIAERALLEVLPVHVQPHAVDVVCGVCCMFAFDSTYLTKPSTLPIPPSGACQSPGVRRLAR